MPDIDITASGQHEYAVTIAADGGTQTEHQVRVPESLLEQLGLAAAQEPLLVRASMLYLLEREPASSVLPSFGLDDIARYFPDYPTEIGNWI
jgi:hypothetical protein